MGTQVSGGQRLEVTRIPIRPPGFFQKDTLKVFHRKEPPMTTGRGWCLISGVVVLASLLLAHFHNPYWTVLTALVGLDLLQSGFTDWGFVAWLFDRVVVEPSLQKRA